MSLDESLSSDDNSITDKYFLRIEREIKSIPIQTSTITIYNKITFSLFSLLDIGERFSLYVIFPIDIIYLIIQTLYYDLIKSPCFEKKCLLKFWDRVNDRYLCRYVTPNIYIHCNKIFKGKKCHSIIPRLSGDKCFICKDIACMNCIDHTTKHMDYALRNILIRDEYYGYDYKSLDILKRKIKKKDETILVFICIQCIINMLHLLGYNTIFYNENAAFFKKLLTQVIQEKLDNDQEKLDQDGKYRSLVLILKAIKLDPNRIWRCDKNQ
jgi:hypothetical protein